MNWPHDQVLVFHFLPENLSLCVTNPKSM